jgi:hypothetical protein
VESDWWSTRWHRGDQNVQARQIDGLFDAYPRTRELKEQMKHRALLVGGLALTGGAVLGFTLGFNRSAPSNTQMSTGTQEILYGVGGGLVVASLLTMLLWPDRSHELAQAYNDGLRDDLHLSGTAALKPRARSMAIAPTLVSDGAQSGAGLGLAGRF